MGAEGAEVEEGVGTDGEGEDVDVALHRAPRGCCVVVERGTADAHATVKAQEADGFEVDSSVVLEEEAGEDTARCCEREEEVRTASAYAMFVAQQRGCVRGGLPRANGPADGGRRDRGGGAGGVAARNGGRAALKALARPTRSSGGCPLARIDRVERMGWEVDMAGVPRPKARSGWVRWVVR